MQNQKTILLTHFCGDDIRDSERYLLDLIKHLDKKIFRPVVWCNSLVLAREVKKLNIHTIISDVPTSHRGFNFLFNLKPFFHIIHKSLKIINDEKVQLIHANNGITNHWLHIVARIKKLPLLSQHTSHPTKDRALSDLLYPSLTVGVSQAVIEKLRHDLIPKNKLKIIPNGIDIEHQDQAPVVDIRHLLQLPKRSTVIMTTAYLTHSKGIDLIISALFYLNKKNAQIHLLIVGNGPDKAYLLNMVSNFSLRKNIHFIDETDNTAGLLRGGVDVFVAASRDEATGLVLAEANLARIPVVATNVGGNPEIIEHLVTGILVAEENSIAISEALLTFIENPELRQSMGKSGRDHVMKKFNVKQCALRYQYCYLHLICSPETHLSWFSSWHIKNHLLMWLKGYSIQHHKHTMKQNTKRHKLIKLNYKSLQRAALKNAPFRPVLSRNPL